MAAVEERERGGDWRLWGGDVWTPFGVHGVHGDKCGEAPQLRTRKVAWTPGGCTGMETGVWKIMPWCLAVCLCSVASLWCIRAHLKGMHAWGEGLAASAALVGTRTERHVRT
eukprot:83665-Chlamydomonas_euryale.AAC.2